jgi:hypothetical protein
LGVVPDGRASQKAAEVVAGIGVQDGTDIVEVRYAEEELCAILDRLGHELERVNADADETLIVGLQTDQNTVVLQRPRSGGLTVAQRVLIEEARETYGPALVLGVYEGRPAPRGGGNRGSRPAPPNDGNGGSLLGRSG